MPDHTPKAEDDPETADTENPRSWVGRLFGRQKTETAKAEDSTTTPEIDSQETEASKPQTLDDGLQKTRSGFWQQLGSWLTPGQTVDENLLEMLEDQLLIADIGIAATETIIDTLRRTAHKEKMPNGQWLEEQLKGLLTDILVPCAQQLEISQTHKPFVILMVGINGAGKTTTIGKLAKQFTEQGHQVMLAAGDTFRAAAVEQLETWGERNNIPVIAQHGKADTASVIYDAMQSAQAKNIDILIADTAGRLHTQVGLMDELKKVKRVMQKIDPSAPHEVMLVIDAGMGQNAIMQAKQFDQAIGLTGITLTKLDGTAKGGVIIGVAQQLGLPIRYVGIGEGIADLQAFDAETFVNALLNRPKVRHG